MISKITAISQEKCKGIGNVCYKVHVIPPLHDTYNIIR